MFQYLLNCPTKVSFRSFIGISEKEMVSMTDDFSLEFKGAKVKGLVFLQGKKSLACATNKGDMYIIK